MDSLGIILKNAREKTKYSLDQIADETHISKKYLEALENEEFSIFPGEAYLKGFLRTYCIYLNLNANETIAIYERIKIAETPTPIEQLIPKPRLNLKPVLLITLFSILIIGLIFVSVKGINLAFEYGKKQKIAKTEQNKTQVYKMTIAEPEKILKLKKDDVVEFEYNDQSYNFKIKDLNPVVKIVDSKSNEFFLVNNTNYNIDLNNDNKNEIQLNLKRWNNIEADISVKLSGAGFTDDSKNTMLANVARQNTETIATAAKIDKIEFSLLINEPCNVRYKLDDQDEVETFYSEKTSKNLSANKYMLIWVSNSGIVNLNFQNYNKNYSCGKLGQVSVKLIELTTNSNNENVLQVSSID